MILRDRNDENSIKDDWDKRNSQEGGKMENKIEYLFDRKRDFIKEIDFNDKSIRRQKILFAIISIVFLAIYYLNFNIEMIDLFGIKISDINFKKIFFLVPLLITIQFTYYSFGKLRKSAASFKVRAIEMEIENSLKINVEDIVKKHPYISSHGKVYNYSNEDKLYKIGLNVSRNVIWLPTIYVFILSSIQGCKEAIKSNNKSFILFYFFTISLCIIIIFIMQLSRSFAFLRNPKKNPLN